MMLKVTLHYKKFKSNYDKLHLMVYGIKIDYLIETYDKHNKLIKQYPMSDFEKIEIKKTKSL